MKQSFCDTHILAFLNEWSGSQKPLDFSLSTYFRTHKSLGANDRRTIGEAVYTLIRWKTLFDSIDPSGSFSKRLHLLSLHSIEEYRQDLSIPEFARLGLSPFLFQTLRNAYGLEKTRSIASVLGSLAPIALRTNLLKTTREELLHMLNTRFPVSPGSTPTAIVLSKREPLFSLPEFKAGLFEVQDEGSQKIADLIEAQSGQRVLDYCSGSGGKTLAIAPKMGGKGELYLHDIRARSLQEAVLRLRRAGIQNAQILPPGHSTLKKLLRKMDWVLVDVPCSGTGTLRRNPDMKWKIDQAMIDRLLQEQQAIVKEAIKYVKPGGRLVYATCSILPEENENQVALFTSQWGLKLEKDPLQLLPQMNGPDGFFGAVFKMP
ncbi:MAG TPA: RsmB/NOP family class I SAM-dependent RNA methyltransferase [Chlamydiales bacterium]|jgi:16S rRNA C967 or C1407 C5-methylase (RsmB/RsmF family)|nr:RsmB/NOP family class I SAM-dependent RNA methyltransferase [Chlamydiales bacterium]